ncbi:hypothetical protein CHUAL_009180 [Chamberlinius hualienensis]
MSIQKKIIIVFVIVMATSTMPSGGNANIVKLITTAKNLFRKGVDRSSLTINPVARDCLYCKMGIMYLKLLVDSKMSVTKAVRITANICSWTNIQPREVCRGIAKTYLPTLMYVYKTVKDNLTAEDICGFAIHGVCINLETFLPKFDWNVSFPEQKSQQNFKSQPQQPISTFRILHISDTHWDKKYLEGSISNCNLFLCCRENTSTASGESQTLYAGRYGEIRNQCDIPKITLESMLRYATTQKFDLVYWTGDIPAHNSWEQSQEENLQDIQLTYDFVKSYFTQQNKVFPCCGNHETYPVNNFPVPAVYNVYQISNLYNKLNSCWSDFIPFVNQSTIIKGGYYSIDILPNLRLISLNMNYGHYLNIYDPEDQLTWLIQQLDECERMNKKVHIIGHIPPGMCAYVWGRNYRSILNRYKDTIAAHFYGHTHFDEFEIISDNKNTPVSVAFIGPSVTTYEGVNPAFRIYTLNSKSMQVEDYETHFLDIDDANGSGEAKWKLITSMVCLIYRPIRLRTLLKNCPRMKYNLTDSTG